MIIAHNLAALNSQRQINIKKKEKENTTERMSSGYRVNTAADDAASLAISEKVRAMVRGMNRAALNAQEGISLIQIGDGALNEVHDMLHRLSELSIQSANGTYVNGDRDGMQDELEHICSEIERIAKTTNYNRISLFQDDGYEYECTYGDCSAYSQAEQMDVRSSQQAMDTEVDLSETLNGFVANPPDNEINIIYTTAERVDQAVSATQTPEGSSTLAGNDIMIEGKTLSQILKTEIIPNTVNNILEHYPAFSYLKGSNIGIGLEYFSSGSSGGTTTLAYVKGQVRSSGSVDSSGAVVSRDDYITYTLGINTSVLQNIQNRADLDELEATIAHEMIHAFMDEATTAGMFGKMESSTGGSLTQNVDGFPKWFVEGMAQTASGPGNWLASSTFQITDQSTDSQIQAAIQRNQLGSGTTASEYGTGYLACMYLGAVIEGGGTRSSVVSAATISDGLSKLLNQVIGGESLDAAINKLTNGTFQSCADFQTKFDAGLQDAAAFTRELLAATGSGRGGIVSGDLKAADLTPDSSPGTTVHLFQLDPDHTGVKNLYPDGYKVYSGGAASTSGTPPTGYNPGQTGGTEYGDFVVRGAASGDVAYDAATHTLTVSGNSDVQISLKDGLTSPSNGKIVLQGTGKVTLNNLNLDAADALTVKTDTEITYTGVSELGGITLDNGTDVTFNGTGRLETGAFTSDQTNTVRFHGGAVSVGTNGSGQIAASDIEIDNASVTADLLTPPKNSSGEALYAIDLPWTNKLGGLTADVASISFDGVKSGMVIGNGEKATLWMTADAASLQSTLHKVTVTDADGVSQTLLAKFDPTAANPGFEWVGPFQVLKNGAAAQEGTDYVYEGEKLVIKQAGNYTISGGTISGVNGGDINGSIRLDDQLGADVNILLDGVTCKPASGCALDLGNGNQVTLQLKDGQNNQFQSGNNAAGIRVGENTSLVVENEYGLLGSGKLEATGGSNGAGIGCSNNSNAANSSIEIRSGEIKATGGRYGAGIGAGNRAEFGDINISGGNITAKGGSGGAGIGGAYGAKVGDILITDGTVDASSNEHGAGIGGGWTSTATNGTITISGGDITASSTMHGTGIGAGCQGNSGKITINGDAHIISAKGGDEGAGIGSSWLGECGDIEISGDAVIDEARGGDYGAGIGSGNDDSHVGNILINTNGEVKAYGGENGVGIGSGYSGETDRVSSTGDIDIKKGTVLAQGKTDSTGIGSGRGSTSGNITIGDINNPENKVIVTAIGGMTHNGGNILSYKDKSHSDDSAGTITVTGKGTSLRPGSSGEGLYSTSGSIDKDGNPVYAYPVYLFKDNAVLDAGKQLENFGLLPLDVISGVSKDKISNIQISSDQGAGPWIPDLRHEPLDENYVFIWLPTGNSNNEQKLTITYDYTDDTGVTHQGSTVLDLKFYPDAGVFRVAQQDKPKPAEKPEYITKPKPNPGDQNNGYGKKKHGGGIILQVGATAGVKLEIPRFYFSLKALEMQDLDISTEENAGDAIAVIQNAVTKVSRIRASYGAYQNRLEHTIQNLGQTAENLAAAESRIRDADMAKEAVDYAAASILTQVAEAMLSQRKRDKDQVLELLQGI